MAFVYWIHLPEHTDMFSEGYIGFTSSTVEKRWSGHLIDSKRCPHVTLYKALSKYGDRIVVTTLVEGSNEYCLDLENKLRPANRIGWNIKIGGDFGSIGVKASEEARKKMSDAHSGEKNHFYGKHHTDEMKEKMSKERMGRKLSPETIAKQTAIRTGKKLNLSPEQRAKRSENSKNKKNSTATRAKISASRTGIKLSAETKARISKTRLLEPWRNPRANQEIWEVADTVFLLRESGFSREAVAELVNTTGTKLTTIWQKLKMGWLPLEDTLFLLWTSSIRKQETTDGTSTI